MSNMKLPQALNRAVQHRPSEAATIFRGRTRTWAEVGVRVRRVAGALRDRGISCGERVAIVASNSDDYAELLLAIAWAGGVQVPLNTRWSTAEIAGAIADCRPRILFLDEDFIGDAGHFVSGCAERPMVVTLGDFFCEKAVGTYANMAQSGTVVSESERADDDLAVICYTGGTTGSPKGVMLSHANIISCALLWINALNFTDETRYLHCAGFFHMAGLEPVYAVTLAGGTHVILPKFDAADVLATIEAEKVNFLLFVPTMITMMLNHEDFPKRNLSSVETVEYGASPMPETLLRRLMKEFPDWTLVQGYGCTEATALMTALPPRYHVVDGPLSTKMQTAGRAVPGVEVRIVDEEGSELPRGEVGEIAVRGPVVMLGYWDKPAETAEVLRDGWLHTGDGGRMDEEGFVTIVDRLKDMIVSGGENVYSSEVEQAIYRDPRVSECAVVGIPDDKWGESVHAVVVPRIGETITPNEVIAHCHTLIAGYKCPRTVLVTTDHLPVSGAGKILKQKIRAPFWEGRERAVH